MGSGVNFISGCYDVSYLTKIGKFTFITFVIDFISGYLCQECRRINSRWWSMARTSQKFWRWINTLTCPLMLAGSETKPLCNLARPFSPLTQSCSQNAPQVNSNQLQLQYVLVVSIMVVMLLWDKFASYASLGATRLLCLSRTNMPLVVSLGATCLLCRCMVPQVFRGVA